MSAVRVPDPEVGGRPTWLGVRLPRLEDDRLLSGRARYVADIDLPGMLDVAVVRSVLAHARLTDVRTSAAMEADGVVGVFTAADLEGVGTVPDYYDWARGVATFPLAPGRVRYVGSPIAIVVARDRYAAEDGAELVEVDYDELPSVASIDAALAPGAPRLYDDWPDNRIVHSVADNEDADAAFDDLRVVRGTYTMQRHTAVPMETRGAVAEERDGRLTVWTSTQFPHITRSMLAAVLGLPERNLRVVAPDVGGGFGCKAEVYPEEYLVAWLARRLGVPVRWIEDRYEHMVATGHARDTRVSLEAAVQDDGTIVALRGSIQQDVGSGEIYPGGFNPAFVAQGSLTGPYRIREQKVDVECVVTNKTPSGAYRGFGIPEATFAMERLIDRIGRELGIDALEIRRRMTLDPSDLPFESASGARIDSGSHREALERIVDLVETTAGLERARYADHPRFRVGSGVASYVEGVAPTYYATSGRWTSQDAAVIRFDPDGGATVAVGVSTAGQGLATMVATLASEALDLPMGRIRVVMGDSDASPYGLGGWGSRSTVLAGGAIVKAAAQLTEKASRIAGHLLEASPDDIVQADGRFLIRGSPETSVGWEDVATAALVRTLDLPPDVDPGLEALAAYDIDVDHVPDRRGRMNACATYTNASHGAIVRVDVETGEIRVLRYLVAHDCGRVINPTIVEGQVQGGVAQGVGGVLLEDLPYTPEGQPLATTFMDYLLPTSDDVPPIEVEHIESPAPGTAFGAKGAGEAGIIGPAPAIAQAVEDALSEFSVPEIASTPITARQVLAWIHGGKGTG